MEMQMVKVKTRELEYESVQMLYREREKVQGNVMLEFVNRLESALSLFLAEVKEKEKAAYEVKRETIVIQKKVKQGNKEVVVTGCLVTIQQIKPPHDPLAKIRWSLKFGYISIAEEALIEAIENLDLLPEILTYEADINRLKHIVSQCEAAKKIRHFSRVLTLCEEGLEISSGNLELKILKAEALLQLGSARSADEIRLDVMLSYFSRALCYYEENQLKLAVELLTKALALAPCPTVEKYQKALKKIQEFRFMAKFFQRTDIPLARRYLRQSLTEIENLGYRATAAELAIRAEIESLV